MIEVHLHLVVCHLKHLTHEAHAVLVLQGDDGTYVYHVGVKYTVDLEDTLVKRDDAFCYVFTVSLCGGNGEVECLTLCEFFDLLLKARNSSAEARDKHERLLSCSLFFHFLYTSLCGVEFVCYCVVLIHYQVLF